VNDNKDILIMVGKWAGAATAVAALTALLVTKMEADPKAMPEIKHVKESVQRVSSEVEDLEREYREQQRRQLEILKQQNEYYERKAHEESRQRSAPPATSRPWPQDPYPAYPPPGYYRGQRP